MEKLRVLQFASRRLGVLEFSPAGGAHENLRVWYYYCVQDRSLANTMRAVRKTMRNLSKRCDTNDDLPSRLSRAKVHRYANRTDMLARYRPPNPDKKPLSDPIVRKMMARRLKLLSKLEPRNAA